VSGQGRIAFAVLALVAVLAGGWFMLVAPKRAETTAVAAKIAQAETRRVAAEAVLANAERLRADAKRDAAVVKRLSKAVPKDDDVGALIRQLDAIARANKIDFRAMKLVSSGTPPPAPATAPVGPEGKAAKGAEGEKPAGEKPAGEKPAGEKAAAGTEAGASTAPVAATVAQPPPGAAVGPAGLLTVPFSFTFDGGYLEMQRFLGAIDDLAKNEKGQITVRGRLITVDGFSLAAGRDGFPSVKALVSATAYLAPDAPAAATPPAAGAPVPAAPATGAPAAGGAAG
jgi:hypothetical protein